MHTAHLSLASAAFSRTPNSVFQPRFVIVTLSQEVVAHLIYIETIILILSACCGFPCCTTDMDFHMCDERIFAFTFIMILNTGGVCVVKQSL